MWVLVSRKMRHFGAGLLVAWLLAGCGSEDRGFALVSGESLDWRGDQWLVVNYWAEWCKPCRDEIPHFNDLSQASKQLLVVGVNFDGGAQVQQQAQMLGVTFPTLAQDPSLRLPFERPTVLPTTFIIRPDGQLYRQLIGPQTREQLLRALPASVAL